MNPLPLDDHPGADGVRVGTHQLGLDPPVAAELQGQPVVAVAQVAGHGGGRAGAGDKQVGKRVADQVGKGQAFHPGGLQRHEQLPRGEPLALVPGPDQCGRASRGGFSIRRWQPEQVGQAVQVEIGRDRRPPGPSAGRKRLERDPGLVGRGPLGRVAQGQ